MAAPLADVLDRAAAVLAELRDGRPRWARRRHALRRGAVDAAAARRARGRRGAGAVALGCAAVLAAVGRQDRRGVARVEAAGADPGGAPAAAPRPGAARPCRPSRRRGPTGDIDRAHVTTLLGARTARTAEAFDGDGHERLLDLARTHGFVELQGGVRPLVDDRRPRRRRAGRRRRPQGPRVPPVPELRWHVVQQGHPRPDLRRDRRHHAARDRARAVRRRLGRGQGPPRPRADDPRPAAHPGPASGRRAGGDGHPRPHRPCRRPPPGAAVHRGRRARDPRRADPRAVQPHRPHPRHRRSATSPRPTSSASCSTAAPGCSTSAPSAGSSGAPCAEPSRSATAPASTPAATRSPSGSRSTTSTKHPRAAQTTQDNGRGGCRFHNLWAYRHPDPDDDPDPPLGGGR